MQRRDFLAGIGSAAALGPFTAHARQRLRTIGFLAPASAFSYSQWTAALVQRLRDLGWIDGQTVTIEMRFAEGRNERYAEIAAEFVKLKADVIVTMGAAGAAAMQVTSTIPIVFAIAPDPVASGLVASLARPGGNVTGLVN